MNQETAQVEEPATAYIHLLPVELLHEIFRCLAQYRFVSVPLPPYFSSAAVTHVCSHWRQVALRCADLWCDIPIKRGIEWTNVALQRSQGRPLSVNVSLEGVEGFSYYRKAAIAVIGEFSRIADLTIAEEGIENEWDEPDHLPPAEIMEFIDLLEQQRAPALKVLSLQTSSITLSEVFNPFAMTVTLGQLRSFHSNRCRIPPMSPLFGPLSLTHLSLEDGTTWDTVEQFFIMLSHLPSLESLALCYEFETSIDNLSAPSPEVMKSLRLPHLKKLILEDRPVQATTILQYLPILPSTIFEITLHCEDEPADGVSLASNLKRAILTLFAGAIANNLSFCSAVLSIQDIWFHVDCSSTLVDQKILPLATAVQTTLLPEKWKLDIIGASRTPTVLLAMLEMACSLPVLNGVRPLHVEGDGRQTGTLFPPEEDPPPFWMPSMSSVSKHFHSLRVRSTTVARQIALAMNADTEDYLPHLKELTLASINLLDASTDNMTLALLLLMGLRHKKQAGHPLRQLSIAECAVTSDIVDVLRDSAGVQEVVWDGKDVRHKTPQY